jgi:hypothetical protein
VNGERKDSLKFRPLGCREWMHLSKDQCEKGKHALRAVEMVNAIIVAIQFIIFSEVLIEDSNGR